MTATQAPPRPRSSAARATPEPTVPRIGARRPVRTAVRRRRGVLGCPPARLRAAVCTVVALLALLGARLVQLQGIESTTYAQQAQDGRLRTVTLPSVRGAVADRWGHVLARDVDMRLVFGDPTLVTRPAETAAALAPLLGQRADAVAARLRQPRTSYVVLAHLVDVEAAREVMDLRLPGIGTVRESRREHPGAQLAAPLLGVVGADGHGASGVEAKLDTLLHGRDGLLREETDPVGRTIPTGVRTETPAADGSGVRLTIDRDLQWAAEDALRTQVAASAARGGQVVVTDSRTGDVLALASAPFFDPDKARTATTPLGIPALDAPYEPGSVNKVITAAAALESGLVTPTTTYTVPNRYAVVGRGGVPVRDAEEHGVEHLTFAGVLAKSSNIGTVMAAQQIGRQRVYDTLRAFGLGAPTGVDFAGESPGVLPPLARWDVSTETTIPFGQGMSATGLQVASVYSTIANGGVRMPPRLLRSTVAPDGTVREEPQAQPRRAVSAATAGTLTAMMEEVATVRGTAPKAAIPGYRIAGKTGTADAVDPLTHAYTRKISSFAGFAPADAPRFVVSVSIDTPTRGSYFGGEIAAPVFRAVMGFALREFAVPPTGKRSPLLVLCWGDRAGCGADGQ